jgi:predicted nucleotidyltransferase
LSAQSSSLDRRLTSEPTGISFGSYARGDAGPDTDVDLLVELAEKSFDRSMALKEFIEELLVEACAKINRSTSELSLEHFRKDERDRCGRADPRGLRRRCRPLQSICR